MQNKHFQEFYFLYEGSFTPFFRMVHPYINPVIIWMNFKNAAICLYGISKNYLIPIYEKSIYLLWVTDYLHLQFKGRIVLKGTARSLLFRDTQLLSSSRFRKCVARRTLIFDHFIYQVMLLFGKMRKLPWVFYYTKSLMNIVKATSKNFNRQINIYFKWEVSPVFRKAQKEILTFQTKYTTISFNIRRWKRETRKSSLQRVGEWWKSTGRARLYTLEPTPEFQ